MSLSTFPITHNVELTHVGNTTITQPATGTNFVPDSDHDHSSTSSRSMESGSEENSQGYITPPESGINSIKEYFLN